MAVRGSADFVHFTPLVQEMLPASAFVTLCDTRMMQTEDLVINKTFYINNISIYLVIQSLFCYLYSGLW